MHLLLIYIPAVLLLFMQILEQLEGELESITPFATTAGSFLHQLVISTNVDTNVLSTSMEHFLSESLIPRVIFWLINTTSNAPSVQAMRACSFIFSVRREKAFRIEHPRHNQGVNHFTLVDVAKHFLQGWQVIIDDVVTD
ncbi:hypothetical protein WT58_24010 [Burkholderia territorii]|nr:hypothetical protein WT58_24010 [Burkholderia territorii]